MKFNNKLQLFAILMLICCLFQLFRQYRLFPMNDSQPRIFTYNHYSPLVIISGYPGTGMNLMRQLINKFSNVYCQKDSSTIRSMLTSYTMLIENQPIEMNRLMEAKITKKTIYNAYQSFILELFLQRNKFSEILCNTEYLNRNHTVLLKDMFPNLKLILMIRDGRAVLFTHARNKGFKSFDFASRNMKSNLLFDRWANSTSEMFDFCMKIGKRSCLLVCKFYSSLYLL